MKNIILKILYSLIVSLIVAVLAFPAIFGSMCYESSVCVSFSFYVICSPVALLAIYFLYVVAKQGEAGAAKSGAEKFFNHINILASILSVPFVAIMFTNVSSYASLDLMMLPYFLVAIFPLLSFLAHKMILKRNSILNNSFLNTMLVLNLIYLLCAFVAFIFGLIMMNNSRWAF